MKYTYRIYEVDAWADDEGWTYNDAFHIGDLTTGARYPERAIYKFLHNHGILFINGAVRMETDGENYEIVARKTGEPLYSAVLVY